MVHEYNKVMATAEAMRRRGGSFVHQLGRMVPLADPQNRAKLMEAFPEYFEEYRATAEKANWYSDE